MKSPEKKPPIEGMAITNDSANAPTIDITEAALTGMELEANAPKLTPPVVQAEAVTAFGAAVWQHDKRVNALYNTHHARNSWMSVAGLGWKKLATGSDSACEAMTLLASHCREKACRIDFSEENGLVKEIYVW